MVLALVVAKLFLYDLAAVTPILRILLFCGFGTAFLLAAYLFGGRKGQNPFQILMRVPRRQPGGDTPFFAWWHGPVELGRRAIPIWISSQSLPPMRRHPRRRPNSLNPAFW